MYEDSSQSSAEEENEDLKHSGPYVIPVRRARSQIDIRSRENRRLTKQREQRTYLPREDHRDTEDLLIE